MQASPRGRGSTGTPQSRERELVEVPIEGTGEWIETGEHDEEFGLEITEWAGDWQTINIGDCAECQHQQEALLAEFDPMNQDQKATEVERTS